MERMREDRERGTVMLEGVFGVLICIIVMAFLLSFGFYLYQRVLVSIVANEIAEEVVTTYKLRNVSGAADISLDDVEGVGLYRYLLRGGSFANANEKKAVALAGARLPQTSLARARSSPTVHIEKIGGDVGRTHYEVTLTQEYTFMLGDLLKLAGIRTTGTISSTVYVESRDISNYFNTVKLVNYSLNKLGSAVPALKAVDSVIKLMNSVYGFFK